MIQISLTPGEYRYFFFGLSNPVLEQIRIWQPREMQESLREQIMAQDLFCIGFGQTLFAVGTELAKVFGPFGDTDREEDFSGI